MKSFPWLSLAECSGKIREQALRSEDLVSVCLDRIKGLDPGLRAFITVAEDVMGTARRLDRELESGRYRGPLHGIPISVKDLILTRDLPTSAGSRVFGDGILSDWDAPVVARLRRAGAVIIGKTNLHEFAYGVTNENSHYGAARNPWDPSRISGGSSGGSAVSVAAGMCLGSIGSDTRGSIRIPSAFCGLTGLKPTLGKLPTDGVIPLSWTLDHVGPMARSAEDLALLLDELARPRHFRYSAASRQEPGRKIRLGVCAQFLENLDHRVERGVRQAIEVFRDRGFKVRWLPVGGLAEALGASAAIASVEALAYHRNHLTESREDFDPSVLKRLEKGRRFGAEDYALALRSREVVKATFLEVFREFDCLLGAVVPALPPHVSTGRLEINGIEVFEVVEQLVRFNAPLNVAGLPALALPCGFSPEGLPISVQLIGNSGREDLLIQLGAAFQRWTKWHLRHPLI